MSFGPLAEAHSPAGYGPKDLTEDSRRGKREGEKGEDETVVMFLRTSVTGRIRIVVRDSRGDFLGDSCDLSGCAPEVSSGVLVATDVLDFPSSLVVMSEAFLSDSDWEIVEPQSFSFSKKRHAVCVENQEDMNYEGTPVKAPPASRRKIMPHTPQQSLQPSIEAMHLQTEEEDQESCSCEMEFEGEHRWTARDRTVIARMEQYLNKNDNMKVEIEELEFLLGPEDPEVHLRHILRYARKKKGGRIFEVFSSKWLSEFLIVSRVRWDERQRVLVAQEEESRSKAQEADHEVNQSLAAVYQLIARRMLSYLDNSEALKVSTNEMKEQILSPSEPSVNIKRIARQARSEKRKKMFQIFSRQGANEFPVASMARWEKHLGMLCWRVNTWRAS